jgi:Xaa-Pro aminopeptidase
MQEVIMEESFLRRSSRGLSRRDVLHGAALGIAASASGLALPGFAAGQQTGPSAAASAGLTPASMPQGFSKEEYPRRWQRLRALMKERNLDCVISPNWGDDEPSDVAYLTGTGGAWVVFPYEGKVAVIGGNGKGENEAGVELRPDGRPPDSLAENIVSSHPAPALIAALREKGLAKARIGVGYLWGARREEGVVSYTTLDPVVKAFPDARFESAHDVMMRVRMVRSQEEIAVMEKAVAVAELAVQTMKETARPGVSVLALWLAMYRTVVEASGSEPFLALEPSHAEGVPRERSPRMLGSYSNERGGPPSASERLSAGQILNQEISARVLGYNMQVNHPICIGAPAPPGWEAGAKKGIDAFYTLLDFIRPGRIVREMNALFAKLAEFEETDSNVVFHFGDGYRIGPNRPEPRAQDLVVEEGWVFHTLKPQIPLPPYTGLQARANGMFARFGDGVVVTANGARRLGTRKFDVVQVGT